MKKVLLSFFMSLFLFAGMQSSFGQEILDNWTFDSDAVAYSKNTTNFHGGTTSVDITWTSQSNQYLNSDEIAVTAGQALAVSMWAYDNDLAGRARLCVTYTGASTLYIDYSTDGDVWEEISYSGTVPDGATAARIQLRFYDISGDWDGDATVTLDDVSLTLDGGSNLVANPGFENWTVQPIISNIATNPAIVQATDVVTVSADVNANTTTVNSVALNWGTVSGTLGASIPMTNSAGDTWTADSNIPVQAEGTSVYYEVEVTYNTSETLKSDESSYDVVAVTEVADISALRAGLTDGTIYKLTSEVIMTFDTKNYRNQKYLYDGTAGIVIDDNSGKITTAYTNGDGITGIVGTLSTYSGLLQFIPSSDPGAATSTGNAIIIQEPTMAEFETNFEDYESELVRFKNVTVNSAPASGKFNITDGTTTLTVDDNLFSDAESGVAIDDVYTITGFAYQKTDIFVTPRDAADIANVDATVSDLKYNDILVEGFDPATLVYNVDLPIGSTEEPVVSATKNDANADINIVQATDVEGDEAARTATVTVTAEDGFNINVYKVIFSVIQPGADATLSDLLVDGVSVDGFDAIVTEYNYVLEVGTVTVPEVTYTLNDANANAAIVDATKLDGTEAERTTTVTVTAQNEINEKIYKVIFRLKSTDATLTSDLYTIDNEAGTIVGVGFGTELADFELALTPAAGATIETYEADATTVATDLQTGYKVIVTAESGDTKTYTVELDAETGDIFFSEYIEGSGNNKAFEIYNPNDEAVMLNQYTVKQSHNGTGWGVDGVEYVLDLSGTLAAKDVFVVAGSDAVDAIKNEADLVSVYGEGEGSKVVFFSGDDALGLFKNGVLIDVIGIADERPDGGWTVGDTTIATKNNTLLRKFSVTAGNTDWVVSAGTNNETSEWIVKAEDYNENIGLFTPEPTGQNDLELFELTVYPNPTSGNVTIEGVMKNSTLEIYNIQGQMIYSSTVSESGIVTMNISENPAGLYFVKVANGAESKVVKLMLK